MVVCELCVYLWTMSNTKTQMMDNITENCYQAVEYFIDQEMVWNLTGDRHFYTLQLINAFADRNPDKGREAVEFFIGAGFLQDLTSDSRFFVKELCDWVVAY